MKQVYKLTALILALVMLLSLTGCSFLGKSRTAESDREALQSILDDLAQNFHPGTAGSSLTSLRLAADLVTWATTSEMDKKEAASIVMDWLKVQSPEIKAAFQEKMQHVSDSYGQIIKDGSKDLLEMVGVEKDMSNLGSRLKELVEAVLATGGVEQK